MIRTFNRAAEHYHWMAWTVFAAAMSGKGRLLQYQHFHSIKFELRVQAALIQLWKWKRAADRKTWEMTDVFSHAVKYLPETHLHTIKIKTFLVLISSGVSLNPLSTPELSYRRRLALLLLQDPGGFFPMGSCVSAGGVYSPGCQERYLHHVGPPARMLGPERTGPCHKSWD